MKVLVAGHSVRHIACSAARAGYEVIAADGFCDLDLRMSVSRVVTFPLDPLPQEVLRRRIEKLVEDFRPHAIVLGPGMEELTLQGDLEQLNVPAPLARRVGDKLWLGLWLERRGFPAVPTKRLELRDLTSLGDGPLIIKPRRGAGGVGCRRWGEKDVEGEETSLVPEKSFWKMSFPGSGSSPQVGGDPGEGIDTPRRDTSRPEKGGSTFSKHEEMVVQPFIDGLPASASVVGDGESAVCISVNEQLAGLPWLGCGDFRYCGTVTPLDPNLVPALAITKMARLAEEVTSSLGLIGSVGVDFLVHEGEPVVLEVNPRFQGSLDAVEMATGRNVFQDHWQAFHGSLPHKGMKAHCAAGRAVLYARGDLKVTSFLGLPPHLADVPPPGTAIKAGDPIISLLAREKGPERVKKRLRSLSSRVSREVANLKREEDSRYS